VSSFEHGNDSGSMKGEGALENLSDSDPLKKDYGDIIY
jgi:hypothetical protein